MYNFDGVRRLMSVYFGKTNAEPKPNPADVEEGKWATFEEVDQMIKNSEAMPTLAVALELLKGVLKRGA
jgi:isopentenyldiphosphate isomerase